jgi:hypothetical protein
MEAPAMCRGLRFFGLAHHNARAIAETMTDQATKSGMMEVVRIYECRFWPKADIQAMSARTSAFGGKADSLCSL